MIPVPSWWPMGCPVRHGPSPRGHWLAPVLVAARYLFCCRCTAHAWRELIDLAYKTPRSIGSDESLITIVCYRPPACGWQVSVLPIAVVQRQHPAHTGCTAGYGGRGPEVCPANGTYGACRGVGHGGGLWCSLLKRGTPTTLVRDGISLALADQTTCVEALDT